MFEKSYRHIFSTEVSYSVQQIFLHRFASLELII